MAGEPTGEIGMPLFRRDLLQGGGFAVLSAALPRFTQAQSVDRSTPESPQGAADYTIRIGNGLVELAPARINASAGTRRVAHALPRADTHDGRHYKCTAPHEDNRLLSDDSGDPIYSGAMRK